MSVSARDLSMLLRHVAAEMGDSPADIAATIGVHENTVWNWRQAKGLDTVCRYLAYFEARGYVLKLSRSPQNLVGPRLT